MLLLSLSTTESSSLDAIIAWIIQGQLCERVMKMGCVLMETSKMVELDNNIRNNGADHWQWVIAQFSGCLSMLP